MSLATSPEGRYDGRGYRLAYVVVDQFLEHTSQGLRGRCVAVGAHPAFEHVRIGAVGRSSVEGLLDLGRLDGSGYRLAKDTVQRDNLVLGEALLNQVEHLTSVHGALLRTVLRDRNTATAGFCRRKLSCKNRAKITYPQVIHKRFWVIFLLGLFFGIYDFQDVIKSLTLVLLDFSGYFLVIFGFLHDRLVFGLFSDFYCPQVIHNQLELRVFY